MLEQGREAYGRRAWLDAHDLLTRAHEQAALEAPDLDLLATCAFMLGRDDESAAWLERPPHRLLDEGMVAVTAEELSPIVTGIVYCGVILACQEVYEVRRAREWTRALDDWWALQPEMVAFTGRCLVHRAEVLQLDGAWRDALEEARRAGERFAGTKN